MNLINQKILPKELFDLLIDDEIHWNGGALITSIDYFEDDAKIELSFLLNGSDEKKQFWEMQLSNIKEERIDRGWIDNIFIYDQHFLIQEQIEENVELYIKSQPLTPYKLFSELYLHFKKLYLGLIPFEKYLINIGSDENNLFKMNYGLIARGPKFILAEIKTILEKNGCKAYYTVAQKNQTTITNSINLKLIELGKTFFIAEDITFERV